MTRQMTLVGFMQAGNVTVYSGSWRYPSADLGFLTMDYYTRIGKVLAIAVSTGSLHGWQ